MPNTQLQKFEAIGKQIDDVLDMCKPIVEGTKSTFVEALQLAHGIEQLREIFNQKQIRDRIEAMQNTSLGFLTDRSPAMIARAKNKGKTLEPYPYEIIREACIEAMLNGYRISNNEFNVIAGRYYAAKNGKSRKIDQTPGLSNFEFTLSPPQYVSETRSGGGRVEYARIQGYASWMMNGAEVTLGHKAEDKCVFKIHIFSSTSDDEVLGKAESKLYSRVLKRITGKWFSEIEIGDETATLSETQADTLPVITIDHDKIAAFNKHFMKYFNIEEGQMFPDDFQLFIKECADAQEPIMSTDEFISASIDDPGLDGLQTLFGQWLDNQTSSDNQEGGPPGS